MENLKLLSKLALSFPLSFQDVNNFDKEMEEVLEYIGEFLNISRIYIFLNESDEVVNNVFEWCNVGITPQKENLQKIRYEDIPSFNKIFKSHGRILSDDIMNLPQDLIDVLEPQEVKSLVINSLIIGKKIKGFIGFDQCKYKHKWKAEEEEILKIVSVLISSAYERKYFQQNIIDSEKNFRNFFETIEDMFIVSDLNGKIIYGNKALVKKLEYSSQELEKMDIIDLYPEEIKSSAPMILEKILKKQRENYTLGLESKSGQQYSAEIRVWFGKWNNQDCIYIVSKDVTKENENSLLFHKIFQNNPLSMAITSIDKREFIKVNPALLEKIGYKKEEMIGKSIEELDLFLDYDKLEAAGKIRKEKGAIRDVELVLRCKDGSLIDGVFSMEEIISGGKSSLLTVIVDVTERVELTRNLEDKYEKLSNIIEGTNLGTWEWNIKTGELEINEQWAKMIGYSLEELGQINIDTWTRFPHPEDLIFSNKEIEKHLNGEINLYEDEIRMKHKDGRWIWVHDRGKVTERDENGLPIKMFGTHTDISLRKEAEQALKESEKRFSLALEKTNAGLWDMDMISGDVFLSSSWKKILGYDDDEIENSYKAWKELWHPDDEEKIQKAVDEYLEDKSQNYEVIHRLKHKDGSWRWILTSGGMLRDETGASYRWIGTNIDITKEHEQSLELERFFSVNLDLLCIVDVEGNFIKTNKAWEDILGYSSDELEKSNVLDFIHPEDISKTLETMKQLKEDEIVLNFTNRYISADGDYHYIEWRSNQYEGIIYAAARDITDRIEYEKKILEISNRDSLTNVYNRRYVMNRVEEIVEEHKRTGKIFSLCILDIDHFKKINDKHGHQIGDSVLKEFTKIIDKNLRPYDILGRYGGEEFIIILNNADEKQSELVIDRILNIIRKETFLFNGKEIEFTFSGGIVNSREIDKEKMSVEILVEVADKRMYQAKEEGRNKIITIKNSSDFIS